MWVDIVGYEGYYQVHREGAVRSLHREPKTLALAPTSAGYLSCVLSKHGRKRTHLLHRLLAKHFLPASTYNCVNHIDGDKLNNSLDNLEWCSYSHNLIHARKTGLRKELNMRMPVIGTHGVIRCDLHFRSQVEAATVLTGNRKLATLISACIKGKRKTALGYIWRKADVSVY